MNRRPYIGVGRCYICRLAGKSLLHGGICLSCKIAAIRIGSVWASNDGQRKIAIGEKYVYHNETLFRFIETLGAKG